MRKILLSVAAICLMSVSGLAESYSCGDMPKWRQLAELGSADAQFVLGKDYMSGQCGIKDEAEAFKWFRLAASQGDAVAQTTVGFYYVQGKVIPRDFTEGARWLKMAADKGIPLAQKLLGLLYVAGKGVEQNTSIACFWFRKACNGGEKESCSYLNQYLNQY